MSTHPYRTHTCSQLRRPHAGETARLSGWIHRKRDHGGVLFVDLRDHYGITQLVFYPDRPFYAKIAHLSRESVVTVTGQVAERTLENINPNVETGEVELHVDELAVLSEAAPLPFPIAEDQRPGSPIAFSTSGASGSTATCSSARRSSPASAGA